MRPISIRCSWGWHNAEEVDEHGRRFCSRCGERERKRPALVRENDRVMTRPKTKGQKRWT